MTFWHPSNLFTNSSFQRIHSNPALILQPSYSLNMITRNLWAHVRYQLSISPKTTTYSYITLQTDHLKPLVSLHSPPFLISYTRLIPISPIRLRDPCLPSLISGAAFVSLPSPTHHQKYPTTLTVCFLVSAIHPSILFIFPFSRNYFYFLFVEPYL